MQDAEWRRRTIDHAHKPCDPTFEVGSLQALDSTPIERREDIEGDIGPGAYPIEPACHVRASVQDPV